MVRDESAPMSGAQLVGHESERLRKLQPLVALAKSMGEAEAKRHIERTECVDGGASSSVR